MAPSSSGGGELGAGVDATPFGLLVEGAGACILVTALVGEAS